MQILTLSEVGEVATADQVRELKTMMETMMAQLDDLQAEGAGIKADLDQIKAYILSQQDKITNLTNALNQVNQTTPPQVDLSGVIAQATDIKNEADAIVAAFTPAPAPTPDPTPAPVTDPTGSSGSTDTPTPPADATGGTAGTGTDTSGATSTPTPPADGSQSADVTP